MMVDIPPTKTNTIYEVYEPSWTFYNLDQISAVAIGVTGTIVLYHLSHLGFLWIALWNINRSLK